MALERWQTGYLPVYAAWAWIVVLAFPTVQLRLTEKVRPNDANVDGPVGAE